MSEAGSNATEFTQPATAVRVRIALPRNAVTACAIAAASLVITAVFWMAFPDYRLMTGTDFAAYYEPMARKIVSGEGLLNEDGSPATRYPPGYPVIVSAVFAAAQAGVPENVGFAAVAVIAMTFSCVLLWWMARAVWPSARAQLPALLWMTYPLILWLSLQRSTEVPFTALFYASVAAFWFATQETRPRAGLYLASGVLLGLAMLIRPIAIGVWIVFLAAIWMFRKDVARAVRLKLGAALLAGILLAVAPWEVWVWQKSGRVIALSDGGAPSVRDGLTFALNQKRYRQGIKVPDDVEALMWRLHAKYDSLDTMGATVAAMWQETTTRPDTVVKLFAIKALRSWFGTDSHGQERMTGAFQLIYLLCAGWGGWLCWRAGGRARQLVFLVGGITLYFWAMTVMVLSIVRYMAPVMGLLFLLTPPLLEYVPRFKRARQA